jgi:protease-4
MSFDKNLDAQTLLNKMVFDFLKQQRHQRYWKWFKRVCIIALLGFLVSQVVLEVLADKKMRLRPHVGLIDIKGEIGDNNLASADNFSKSLDKAYKAQNLKAVVLRINSPGGSPVQADYMFNLLKYYRQQHPGTPIYAVCTDTCASAAYYVAVAADKIYANPASIVGSIGVVYNGFGFDQLMNKVGITRRLMIAGKNKGIMDPFSPENPEQKALMQKMIDEIHQQFIARVKEGRGQRLKIDDETFSGLPWTGQDALGRGLIDEFGSTGDLIRKVIKVTDVVDYTEKPSVVEQFSKNVGANLNLDVGSLEKWSHLKSSIL